jgi:3-dehydroquinate dehydratase
MTTETKKIVITVRAAVETHTLQGLQDDLRQAWLARAVENALDLDKFWGEEVVEITVEEDNDE